MELKGTTVLLLPIKRAAGLLPAQTWILLHNCRSSYKMLVVLLTVALLALSPARTLCEEGWSESSRTRDRGIETERARAGSKVQGEERRKDTLKIVGEETKEELEEDKRSLSALNTDRENDEEKYEAWKVREPKRIKRVREDQETLKKEKAEIKHLRNLTEEEERQAELRANGKVITNKTVKGKYKFLQKYYHRDAFFMNVDEEVYKRDFSAPTLENHFNKTILPKVMQVKNPNTPTLWFKIPPPSTHHGAKRVPRTRNSLDRRQLEYEMCLSDHLPRRGKLPTVQLFIPTVGHQGMSQHLVLDILLSLFTWFLYPPYWTYCHTISG
ncbi:Microfibrillar-associated protein 1 [Sciurus carolinensis]|uniref:Microfibrillar-associated protein 1 n=1 Tax=Sciurus carolinensis TaxID=30640 RepID=A0AA41NAJ4_SCICA|nr:Microfibrillar-associated protein 1 [Sciurus carolinensis]